MNLSDFSPEAQRLEHLIRAREELRQAMSPVPRTNFVDGYLASIYDSLIQLIHTVEYPEAENPHISQP